MSKKHLLVRYDTENDGLALGLKRSIEGANSSVVVSHNTDSENGVLALGLKRSIEVANSSVVASHNMARMGDGTKVKDTLKLFHDLYDQLLEEYNQQPKQEGQGRKRIDVLAANRLKKNGKWIFPKDRFGHIPGVEIGDKFHFRVELVIVGLHCQFISGIDHEVVRGQKIATSVVNSGRYDNKAKTDDVLVYSGQGGLMGRGVKADHELKRGNLALVNSMKAKYPVRVIQKTMSGPHGFSYTYDGLFIVKKYWKERDGDGKMVFKFELNRMIEQLETRETGKKLRLKECCVVKDVSNGYEVQQVRAMNGVDGEKPKVFSYTTKTIYPEWCREIVGRGCDCIHGCSNSRGCYCVSKNGGQIPYGEKGGLLRPKGIVHECGPSCNCPPSCPNRVSLREPRYQLELYKTNSKEWSVRSRSYVSSGSFVCELVGTLKQFKDVEWNVDDDMHRFSSFVIPHMNHDDVSTNSVGNRSNENGTRFVIDSSRVGNVGRFIRKGNTPNLVVQHVLYDHDDIRMPHIMFFCNKEYTSIARVIL